MGLQPGLISIKLLILIAKFEIILLNKGIVNDLGELRQPVVSTKKVEKILLNCFVFLSGLQYFFQPELHSKIEYVPVLYNNLLLIALSCEWEWETEKHMEVTLF